MECNLYKIEQSNDSRAQTSGTFIIVDLDLNVHLSRINVISLSLNK
jgi:hypothetical protein